MAFVSLNGALALRSRRVARTCHVRMTEDNASGNGTPSEPMQPVQRVSNDGPVAGRKLVRNATNLPVTTTPQYAEPAPGDMGKAPKVGEGMGPRRGVAEKKVTRAAAIQKSQSFADAWAEQNQGRPDIWLVIGVLFLLTPILIIVWAVVSGAIPTGGLFDQ